MSSVNGRPLLYKLSPQIICNILLLLKEFNTPSLSSDQKLIGLEYDVSHYRWIVDITHISTFFRNITLDCPDLWTNIPLYSQKLAAMFLERSGSTSRLTWLVELDNNASPASADWDEWASTHLAYLPKLTNTYLSRIKILQVRAPSKHLLYILPKLDSSSSELHELRLLNLGGSRPFKNCLQHNSVAAFGDCAPNLQVLELQIDILGIEWKPIRRLTRLRLLNITSDCGLNYIMPILNLVAQNPQLEELVIMGIDIILDWTRTQVDLPVLRKLVLHGNVDESISLLNSLVFPESANLVWHGFLPDDMEETGAILNKTRPLITSLLSRTADTGIAHLSLGHQNSVGGEVYFTLRPDSCHACPPGRSHGSTTVHFKIQSKNAIVPKMLITYCHVLNISRIDSLFLYPAPLDLRLLESARPSRGTISIVDNPSLKLLYFALVPTRYFESPLCSQPIRVLSIENSNFTKAEFNYVLGEPKVFFYELMAFLELARNSPMGMGIAGQELFRVEMTNCRNVLPEMVEELELLVDVVTWDGQGAPEPNAGTTQVEVEVNPDEVLKHGGYFSLR